ncbi:MAG: 4-hydroxy-tetrahydrodipicolinate synthase [Fusobacteriaceae bacterium]|jgi:4-hydroxy-tetrahydrodipicolinate synthase|nr:4-hydroxy-tetrahydrodipicolinate synthase [Fusobacteriaceae bacterium]
MSIFIGSGVALVTPIDANNKINYNVISDLIDFHLKNDTDALIINGSTGESPTISDIEKIEILKFVVKKVNGKIPVIAGTGTNDTAHAIRTSIDAEKCGVDALLVVTPYYNKGNDSGIFDYYKKIAGSVKIPIIIYVVPSRTGVNLSIKLLKQLAQIENIVAIKDATGNLSYTAQIAAEIPKLDIYSGNDDVAVPVISLGGKGVISVSANIIPKETHEMAWASYNNDYDKARKLQLKYLSLINSLFIEVNPIPVKEAMNVLGFDVGSCRSPLGPIAEEAKIKIIENLSKNGVKL